MKMVFDYTANAACPQRPAWQITPVNYEWARVVFHERNPYCVCDVKKEVKPRQCRKVFEGMFASLFMRRREEPYIPRKAAGAL
ncbi:MAG: hypothetical protein LBB81_03010 [Treponema sp.]|jgi:hypothetical protein|nr:hypothetical protein [Treponema sp.]